MKRKRENPYGFDRQLPVLSSNPSANPGIGLGTNWHPSQPVRNVWDDWAAPRPVFPFNAAAAAVRTPSSRRQRPARAHAPPQAAPTAVPVLAPTVAPSAATERLLERLQAEQAARVAARKKRNRDAARHLRRRRQHYQQLLEEVRRGVRSSRGGIRLTRWRAPARRSTAG